MSIQALREKYAATRPAMAAVDPTWLAQFEKQLDKVAGPSAHPADQRRLAREANNKAVEVLGRDDFASATHGPAVEALQAAADLLAYQADLNATNSGVSQSDAKRNAWRNAQTGEPVRVLGSGESIARSTSEIGVGDLMAGLAFGTKSEAVRNALTTGTDTAGGFSVPLEILDPFVDALRAQTRVIQAGAQTLLLDQGKTRIVRIDQDPTPAWRAENAAITEGAPVFGAVEFEARSLDVLVKVSEEILADAVNVEEALQATLLGALSTELDRVALFGTGTAPQPRGLFNTAGVTTVSMGTNGAVPTNFDPLLDAVYEVESRNAMPTAAIMHPRTARTMRKLKDTTGQPMRAPAPLDTLPLLATTSVPINQVQGTSNVASTVIVGDFSRLILGVRQSLTIRRLNEIFADHRQVAFIASMRADIGVTTPGAFARITGITA